ncbi:MULTISPECIES: hypothetical protein [unclassified Leptolyngbya]|uniref:hypothetical protein n=1 Tax=unclassified Leptolyngbya TaxID=2650499 RepID=UPI0016874B64|nr:MULTISPECIES: hypothetical protein [unclassified Leptolyngbya]MBD1910715.1 hypothetical protein [Leptolyngbya sp. FACHB-8]MBD2154312.1 hypothetical protein [Leptolyngbya sp. FACHB-16]
MSSFSLTKWRLFLTVLPFTLLFGLVKVGMHRLGWEPWAFDSLTAALFGSATFVIAFVLSGTLREFNDSANMPVQIANSLETIQDSSLLIAKLSPDYNPQPLTTELIAVAKGLVDWLQQGKPVDDVEAALYRLNANLAGLLQHGNGPIVSRTQTELAKIRILVSQIAIIRDTEFLGPAYALLEIFLVGTVVALLLIGADRFSENLVVSSLLVMSFTYLLLLIRDLDNPFQYDGKSCADVDLSSLETVCDRLHKSMSQE